jgi:hypothetical protein
MRDNLKNHFFRIDYVSLLPDAVGSVALRDAGSELDFMVAATPEPQARYFGA